MEEKNKFLDGVGLGEYDEKIKAYINRRMKCNFTIDENGILTDSESGKQYKLTPYSGAETPTAKPTFYLGSVNSTRAAFTQLTDDAIKNSVNKVEVDNTKSGSFVATENCFMLLVPSTLKLVEVKFTSSGLVTSITSDNLWNLEHGDIVIDNETYKVWGYRIAGVTPEDPLTYEFTIQKA